MVARLLQRRVQPCTAVLVAVAGLTAAERLVVAAVDTLVVQQEMTGREPLGATLAAAARIGRDHWCLPRQA
jgi:hypothetical protein